MAQPYPPIEPYRVSRLKVGSLHEIYVEESGNPSGVPVVFVHGGPGGGCEPWHRQFFDPRRYRIVLFDQRGCGTLALAYAEAHPDRVKALILRGIFLLRPEEIRWFYQEGANWIFPDAWEHYLAPIPEAERGDLVTAYHRRLTSDKADVRRAAARAWSIWEGATSKLLQSEDMIARYGGDAFADAFARIECHYFVNGGFFRSPNQLLEDAHKIRHIPGVIVQGRYDVVCPMKSAWDLHRAWPEAELQIVPDAGHAASENGILNRLIEAADRFSRQ